MSKERKYDFLVVGAGLFGCVAAYELTRANHRVLVIDKNNHIGGMCHTHAPENGEIIVSSYGTHIFSTNNEDLWKFVNQFGEFKKYRYVVKSKLNDGYHTYPPNLDSLNALFACSLDSAQMQQFLQSEKLQIETPRNFEESCLKHFGEKIYKSFIYGYTKKLWGEEPKDLPAEILNRTRLNFDGDDRYYRGKYTAYPINGYTEIFQRMLDGIDIQLSTDFLGDRTYWESVANKVIYTGPLDALFEFCHGPIGWRTVSFEKSRVEKKFAQPELTVHFPDVKVSYSRSSETKHLPGWAKRDTAHTFVVRESFGAFNPTERFLLKPCRTSSSINQFNRYKELAKKEQSFYFGGRTADYKYYDMDETIARARKLVRSL